MSAAQRQRLYNRQHGYCYYCCERMTLRAYSDQHPPTGLDATIEHLVPRILGGTTHPSNLVAACHDCNQLGGRIDLWAAHVFGTAA